VGAGLLLPPPPPPQASALPARDPKRLTSDQIPAKIEGLAFGPDVAGANGVIHTLWVANDNDFLQDFSGPNTNPNQFFVFGFTDADLDGSKFVPQKVHDWFD